MPEPEKQTKKWSIKAANTGTVFDFFPVFLVNEENGDVECKEIQIEVNGKTHRFAYDNLYMFMYFVSNEEMRRKLMQRYEQQITNIPYDVTFKLDTTERETGQAKRRITLQVGEIAMAMVRAEAAMLRSKDPTLKKIFKGT
jgi:hypothetical protein